MRIIYSSGGLGNQIMQYVFKRYREFNSGVEFLVDDTHFCFQENESKLQINKVFPNAKIKWLSDELESDVFENIAQFCVDSNDEVRLPNIFLANGIDMGVIAEENLELNQNYQFEGNYLEVNSQKLYKSQLGFISLKNGSTVDENTDNICFMGTWHDLNFGLSIQDVVLSELAFPEITDEKNLQYKDDITTKDCTIGVHVRRGDFVSSNKAKSVEEYAKIIRSVRFDLVKQGQTPAFYIFSDDLDWCKANQDNFKFGVDDHVVFIEGNNSVDTSYIDMQLMSYCDTLISLKSSSFAMASKLLSHKDITLHQF